MPSITEAVVAIRKFIRIRERNQITLPVEIVSGMAVHPGDFLEIGRTENGSVYLKPTVLVTVGSPEALREESLAEKDVVNGRYETFDSAEEFMEDLKKRRKHRGPHKKEPKKDPVATTARAVTVGK